MQKNSSLSGIIVLLLVSISININPLSALANGEGQAYIVQEGDNLSKIAENMLGNKNAWPTIVEATNRKTAEDSSFTTITDPNVIHVGQKLWIPKVGTEAAHVTQTRATDLKQAYLDAVKDAAVAEPAEINRDLTAITAENPALVWDGSPGTSRVSLVTWTAWDGYDAMVGKAITLTREMWVTVFPQVKTFCRAYAAQNPDLTLRLEQLMGLPPANGKTKFVEIWAKPADLFRPAPDPEITDHEAGLDFPSSQFVTLSEKYKTWFNDLKAKSYGEQGYPWTRLGYTYDWGNSKTDVGLSEFVVNAGANITIRSIAPTANYCQ